MKFRSTILNICLMISTGCLGIGYFLSGHWQILPMLLVISLFGILTKKRFWFASSLLLVYNVLAVIGIIAGLSVGLMIISCTLALVSWDLIQFDLSMGENPQGKPSAPLEKYHLQALAGAASIGSLLAIISSYINWQLPFGVLVSLVLIAMGCLIYGMQYIVRKKL